MSKLKIYKASAGSGKTFKLTEEYLKLVFKNPFNYRHILAVTFTNDATGEMKGRIIKEIYNLSNGSGSPYMGVLCGETSKNEMQIRLLAKEILVKILHDYSKFAIGTIDSFFQRVIRAFTKEAGLQAGYSIELDHETVLTEVIDSMINDIENDRELCNWLVRFAQERVGDGKNWNLEKEIRQLGNEVFKEIFKTFDKKLLEKIQDKKFLDSFLDELYQIRDHFESRLKEFAEVSFRILSRYNLTVDDFSYKEKGMMGFFIKLKDGNFAPPADRPRNACDKVENWHSKTSPATSRIKAAFADGLNKNLTDAISFYDGNYPGYLTSILVTDFIYTLGILTDLSKRLKDYSDENNIFLISNAPVFLSGIIAGNDTPFIYEKTGTVFRHFMIDEFQDTSGMQWENFKPLVCNSLASDFKSLVVGDVKQSIYRWRSGDWKLLGGRIEKDVSRFGSEPERLDYNWRSKKNIIDFNNSFFNCAATFLQDQFNSAIKPERAEKMSYLNSLLENLYADAYQSAPVKEPVHDGGIVNIRFLQHDDTDTWQVAALNELPGLIEKLQEQGFKPKDIAILVRTKKEGKEITDFLTGYKNSESNQGKSCYDVISNEALFINTSPAVRLLVYLMRYLVNPDDKLVKAHVLNEYSRYILKHETLPGGLMGLDSDDMFFGCLPETFHEGIHLMKSLPVFELTEDLIRIFSLHLLQPEIPYLQAFQQLVHDFGKNKSADIVSFLEWWDELGISKTISVSGRQDAMRVLTIHKSKGLEFKAVIVPFCNWAVDHDPKKMNILWCSPADEPFRKLELLPVKYSGVLSSSLFFEDYYIEKMNAFIDNFNLLYVALTRAESALYLFAPAPDRKKEGISTVAHLLYDSVSAYKPGENHAGYEYLSLHDYWIEAEQEFQLGETAYAEGKKYEQHDKDTRLAVYPTFDNKEKLRLRLHSRHFLDNEKQVNYGTIIHDILRNIMTSEDISTAVMAMVTDGRINSGEADFLADKIGSMLSSVEAGDWFSGEWIVKNEQPVLLPGGKTKRPDRVMIGKDKTIVVDYKTGRHMQEHVEQVSEYISILNEMGYPDVKGYIWYLNSGRLIQA